MPLVVWLGNVADAVRRPAERPQAATALPHLALAPEHCGEVVPFT
jgi:hypothetical protein